MRLAPRLRKSLTGIARLILVAVSLSAPAALAQDAPKRVTTYANVGELERALARYYERSFDVPQFLSEWERLGAPAREGMAGFLAGLFAKYPDRIRPAAAAKLGLEGQVAVIQGLRFAGKHTEAINAAKQWNWPPEQIAPITPLQPLRGMKAEGPVAFDIMWAASFATADAAYVRPIFDYYASVAAQPEIDVRDIVAVVMAKHRPNNEAIQALAKKYPRETFMRLLYASSALWSLESNARQHKFVAAALDRYAKDLPTSPATQGLAELRATLAR